MCHGLTLSAFVGRVIDFLIGVGDQLQNPGEEPQAQAEDAVGEEPQDAVGEEPHQTTQTIHLQFKCHQTTQTFHLHQTTLDLHCR